MKNLFTLSLLVAIAVLSSCTRDYFLDENNVQLYIPQMEDGSIQNFYVSFHDANGRHVVTRQLHAPFDQEEKMKQGILRFKLPAGDYSISCFADYAEEAVISTMPYSESYLQKTLVNESGVYGSRTTNPRSVLSTIKAYPLGHPETNNMTMIDINENQRYKGKVKVNFKDLPSSVSRMDVYYKGLATKYCFDGHFDRFSANDRIRASFNVAENTSGNVVLFEDILNPSAHVTPFGIVNNLLTRPITRNQDIMFGEPLELEIRMFNAEGIGIGVIDFTVDDFLQLSASDPAKVPQDADGNPLEHLVLEPQKTIIFNFSGFIIVNIQLEGWGGIEEGEVTPM